MTVRRCRKIIKLSSNRSKVYKINLEFSTKPTAPSAIKINYKDKKYSSKINNSSKKKISSRDLLRKEIAINLLFKNYGSISLNYRGKRKNSGGSWIKLEWRGWRKRRRGKD